MNSAIRTQREQARADAERAATVALNAATEIESFLDIIRQHSEAGAPSTMDIRREIAACITPVLVQAHARAYSSYRSHQDHQNQLTASLAAAVTFKQLDVIEPNQAHLSVLRMGLKTEDPITSPFHDELPPWMTS